MEYLSNIIRIFVLLIDELTATRLDGKQLYIHNGSKLNFRAGDFKKKLADLLPVGEELGDILKTFRVLQFILCEHNRFTNTQRIKGRIVRVITVDNLKYELLKELMKEGDQ